MRPRRVKSSHVDKKKLRRFLSDLQGFCLVTRSRGSAPKLHSGSAPPVVCSCCALEGEWRTRERKGRASVCATESGSLRTRRQPHCAASENTTILLWTAPRRNFLQKSLGRSTVLCEPVCRVTHSTGHGRVRQELSVRLRKKSQVDESLPHPATQPCSALFHPSLHQPSPACP